MPKGKPIHMSKKAFVVVSESYGMASSFMSGVGDREMFLSYAQALPDVTDFKTVSYWLAGGYAARLHRIGLARNFAAPGQNWLTEVSEADEELTLRHISTTPISELPGRVKLFAKPAEAKIDSIPAGVYLASDLRKICKQHAIPENTLFQWTRTILNMNHEHRFFVSDGEVRAGSVYLRNGITYYPGIESSQSDDALEAAEDFIDALDQLDLLPPALTLDVARDEDTGQWLIVEANPAWSSGPYGANRADMIEVLERACNLKATDDPRWIWKPADYLVQQALKQPEMKIVPLSEIGTTSGIFRYDH